MNYNLIIAICLFILGVLIGYLFSLRYSKRTGFYKALSEFNSDFISSLTFNFEELPTLLNRNYNNEDFERTLNSFNYQNDQVLFLPNYLNKREKNEIMLYFSKLGCVDAITQLQMLKRYECIFDKTINECRALEQKEGVLCKKMGVIVGIIIFVLVV